MNGFDLHQFTGLNTQDNNKIGGDQTFILTSPTITRRLGHLGFSVTLAGAPVAI